MASDDLPYHRPYGLLGGLLSGLFGISGGLVIVPGLVLLVGFSLTAAARTSLAALLLPVGALGALEYLRTGQVDLAAAALIALGLLVGAYAGARLGLPLSPDLLRRAFGFLLGGKCDGWHLRRGRPSLIDECAHVHG